MSHIRKSALICNKCGTKLEIDPDVKDPFFSFTTQLESSWCDWMKVSEDHHLCPECAKEYNAKKAEMEQELKKVAGIKTIEFDI